MELSDAPLDALDNVFLEVREGESLGLVGESGSEKTALSTVLLGLEHSTTITVAVGGVNVADWRKLDRNKLATIRRTVHVVFQDPSTTLNPMRSIAGHSPRQLPPTSPAEDKSTVRSTICSNPSGCPTHARSGAMMAERGIGVDYSTIHP
ncbi:MAG: ATP-binding cassette domain-containing protein [Mesorhizobium sp.]|nr:MAG: ATP-binding cassette domain-containing protein [Mesorhizobium sp.]RWF26095.1 MAG: ATP-binding cassette domain-containing protein [Mesorhizobium sp.]TIT10752.1 MAG: ATP-binding cassette domain-containing protein [Mesorhizobium sp.]TIV82855.1 MAG: ATP-binding cassette domain-containing protein [Mesorhizobium sp.]